MQKKEIKNKTMRKKLKKYLKRRNACWENGVKGASRVRVGRGWRKKINEAH